MSVGAIDPVGITNASITNPRNTNAIVNAIMMEISVSFSVSGVGWAGLAALDGLAEVSVGIVVSLRGIGPEPGSSVVCANRHPPAPSHG
jgi:hypothetical protein